MTISATDNRLYVLWENLFQKLQVRIFVRQRCSVPMFLVFTILEGCLPDHFDFFFQISGRLTYLLTSWSRVLLEKLTGFAANQEIPRILWNPKDYYRTHKRPPPVPILSQLQSPQPLPTSSRSILILSSHLRLCLPNGLFPSGFPHQNLVHTVRKMVFIYKNKSRCIF